jgi:hypothetical protein
VGGVTRPQIIVDCETTSLTPDYVTGGGVIWELALIERDCGAERLYRMEPDTARADQAALAVGRFDERTGDMSHYAHAGGPHDSGVTDIAWTGYQTWSRPADLAPHIAGLLDGATLIAANPTFDANYLSAFLAAYDCNPAPWHYRLRDIGSMAWAWLQAHHLPHHLATPPMDAGTDDFARAIGIDPDEFERHSALGDCRLVEAMLRVIEGDGAS